MSSFDATGSYTGNQRLSPVAEEWIPDLTEERLRMHTEQMARERPVPTVLPIGSNIFYVVTLLI